MDAPDATYEYSMNREPALELDRMLSDVLWAKDRGLGPRDLVPMLERLIRCAPRGSDAALFAQRELAELIVETKPWRAARLAREVTIHAEDDRAWALLGLSHTLLGHYKSARKAYLRALQLHPGCPFYSHNLGHLLDVGLKRSREALPHLRLAYRTLPREREIAASYALALARVGRFDEARGIVERALGEPAERAEAMLTSWIEHVR
jgi:tetratricopeptide (TPR) repeat protein